MNEPSRAKWWPRVHLSTWVVVFIVSTVFLSVNVIQSYNDETYGWPLIAAKDEVVIRPLMPYELIDLSGEELSRECKYHLRGVIANIGVCSAILLCVGALFEFLARRGWLRFHLATLVVLSAFVAALIGLNMRPRYYHDSKSFREYGWPRTCFWSPARRALGGAPWGINRFVGAEVEYDYPRRSVFKLSEWQDDERRAFWFNLGISGLILLGTATLSEAVIRRRLKPSAVT